MKAVVRRAEFRPGQRIICISDIHGYISRFTELLKKTNYTESDALVLLGDMYTKGDHGQETLKLIMELCQNPNVYALRGNCDWVEDYFSDKEKLWLEALPHIIETPNFIFVHGGIPSENFGELDARTCMKNDFFMEKGFKFSRYVVTGHWPTVNYTHEVPCNNPIVDEESRIIAIDGGTVIKRGGQLNAFVSEGDSFSFNYTDDYPAFAAPRDQAESGGTINITWNDRFIELVVPGETFGMYRHLATGTTLPIPNEAVWNDSEGRLCVCDYATDYFLPVKAGEIVSEVARFGDRVMAKKNGTLGWISF